MKKIISLSLLACCSLCAAAQLPSAHSAVPLARARQQVKHFASTCCYTTTSFVVKLYGNGPGDYLLSPAKAPATSMLHIYFGEQDGLQPDTDELAMIITGAYLVKNHRTGRKHATNDRQGMVWTATAAKPGQDLPFDCDFDHGNIRKVINCDMSAFSTGATDRNEAAAYISTFQQHDCNIDGRRKTINEAESFLVSTADLRSYLCRNPQVQYLQFYLAYRTMANETTLFMAGLDERGHHVWLRDDNGVPYLFGNALACPDCAIDYDASLDYYHQGPQRYCDEVQ